MAVGSRGNRPQGSQARRTRTIRRVHADEAGQRGQRALQHPDSSAALGFGVPGSIVLAPHASLNVVISFVPSPNGGRSGALTVSDATSARRLA